MARPQPSDLELQVLSILWDSGASSVRQVHEALPDGKKRAYTTVLTVLQNLEHKGLVKHCRKGNSHVYSAAAGQDQILAPLVRRLLRHVFRGKPVQVVQYLLEDPSIDAEELGQIRRLINRHHKSDNRGVGE